MEDNRELTIDELQKQYEEVKRNFKRLSIQLEKKKKEEEELRETKLAKEKDARKKEVNEAFEKYKALLKAYMDDYGNYSYSSDDGVCDLFSSKFWNCII